MKPSKTTNQRLAASPYPIERRAVAPCPVCGRPMEVTMTPLGLFFARCDFKGGCGWREMRIDRGVK